MDRSLRRALSSKDLTDLPPVVRTGSPLDAPDAVVREAVERGLRLHPQTNYGVVYRVALLPRLGDNERPREDLAPGTPIRFALFAVSRVADGDTRRLPHVQESAEPLGEKTWSGWLLVTDRRLLWHYSRDGVPGRRPRHTWPGPREVPYDEVIEIDANPLPGVAADCLSILHEVGGTRLVTLMAFGRPSAGTEPAPDNKRLFEVLEGAIGETTGRQDVSMERRIRLELLSAARQRLAERKGVPVVQWLDCPACGGRLTDKLEHAVHCGGCDRLFTDPNFEPVVIEQPGREGALVGAKPWLPVGITMLHWQDRVLPWIVRPSDTSGPILINDVQLLGDADLL